LEIYVVVNHFADENYNILVTTDKELALSQRPQPVHSLEVEVWVDGVKVDSIIIR